MAMPLRFMIELADPYLAVLYDLAREGCRTHQQQATWIVKKYLEQVIREQEESLDTFLASPDHAERQEVAHAPTA